MLLNNKNKISIKENITAIIIGIFLILIMVLSNRLLNKEIDWIVMIFLIILSFSIGKSLTIYFISLKVKRKKYHFLLSNIALFSYILIYIILTILKDYKVFFLNPLHFYFKLIFGSYILLYVGLNGLRTKKGWVRGYPLTKKAVIIYSIALIILAILFLIFI